MFYLRVCYFHYWIYTSLYLIFYLSQKLEATALPNVDSLNCGRSKFRCADKVLEVALPVEVADKAKTVKLSDKKENGEKKYCSVNIVSVINYTLESIGLILKSLERVNI